MGRNPFVSILIVNYNGRHLLEECLSSVFAVKYPKSQYEVILVDNNSSDDSIRFVAKEYPQVRVVASQANLGFAGGNALALQYAKGELIALLNSDTRVDALWLDELVKAIADPSVGVVNSKIYFSTPFLELKLHTSVLPRADIVDSADFSPYGLLIEDIICAQSDQTPLIWYGPGFYPEIPGEIQLRWTKASAMVMLPCLPNDQANVYKLTVHGYPTDKWVSTTFSVTLGDETLVTDTILSHEVREYQLTISPEQTKRHREWLIQNAGNIILQDGNGKDRGAVIQKKPKISREFYERDSAHFSKKRKLLAFCGASCLIKRSVIDAVGFFHPEYFMYYEDLDLSVRIWMAGWDILYAPKSVVYHKHKATTREQQRPATMFHLEKNYLAFLITYFPSKIILIQALRLLVRFGVTYVKKRVFEFSSNIRRLEEWTEKYQMRKAALWYIVLRMPVLLSRRSHIQQTARRQFSAARELQY